MIPANATKNPYCISISTQHEINPLCLCRVGCSGSLAPVLCQPTYAWEVTETFAAEHMLGPERFCVILMTFRF